MSGDSGTGRPARPAADRTVPRDEVSGHNLLAVGTYGQYCPVARGAEVLADRWTPLLIRELGFGAFRFNEIARGLPRISRTLLSARLRRLEESGIVEQVDGGYCLTPAGAALREVVDQLGRWAARYALGTPEIDELDPALLVWWIHRGIDLDHVPERRIVIEFRLRGCREEKDLWLALERTKCSVRKTKPARSVDLVVEADLAVFYEVWLGRLEFESSLREGTIRLSGAPELVAAFPSWLELSPFAPDVRAVSRVGEPAAA